MPAGYSGTPLIKKLGIKPDTKLLLLNGPDNYAELLETDISQQLITRKSVPDLVNLFAKNNAAFLHGMNTIMPLYKKNTSMVTWVCWYKKSSGMSTDITEDTIRGFALANDLVDVKVCAVSELWSGLKLVVRVEKR